jgi:hypothetical protein
VLDGEVVVIPVVSANDMRMVPRLLYGERVPP